MHKVMAINVYLVEGFSLVVFSHPHFITEDKTTKEKTNNSFPFQESTTEISNTIYSLFYMISQ